MNDINSYKEWTEFLQANALDGFSNCNDDVGRPHFEGHVNCMVCDVTIFNSGSPKAIIEHVQTDEHVLRMLANEHVLHI